MRVQRLSRRRFLERAARTAAAVAGAGAAWTVAASERPAPPLVVTRRPAAPAPVGPAPAPSPLPVLAVVRRSDPGTGDAGGALLATLAIDLLGGIGRFVSPGDRIVVKPNIGWNRAPGQAATTDPAVVAAVVSLCRDAGAREVLVTDTTCNAPRACFGRSGIRDAALAAGGVVRIPGGKDFTRVEIGGRAVERWAVLRAVLDADRLITIPVAKQHGLARYTGAMKNLYGIAGGSRGRLHQKLDQSIVDLVTWARPALSIVDGIRVLLRNGPSGGSLEDVARRDTVIASTDPVAADALGCTLVGLDPGDVPHIMLAADQGLGVLDPREESRVERIV